MISIGVAKSALLHYACCRHTLVAFGFDERWWIHLIKLEVLNKRETFQSSHVVLMVEVIVVAVISPVSFSCKQWSLRNSLYLLKSLLASVVIFFSYWHIMKPIWVKHPSYWDMLCMKGSTVDWSTKKTSLNFKRIGQAIDTDRQQCR